MPAQAGIQYAAVHRYRHNRLGALDRPVEPGEDSRVCREGTAPLVVAKIPSLQRPDREHIRALDDQVAEQAGAVRHPLRVGIDDVKRQRRNVVVG